VSELGREEGNKIENKKHFTKEEAKEIGERLVVNGTNLVLKNSQKE